MSNQIPGGVLHAKTHEWARVREGVAAIGISDHAQHELTDVIFVELPAVGRVLQAGAACAVVESVKTASDVYSPVSGEVTAVNQNLTQHPELVNTDPYGEGWFFEVKLSRPAELNGLLKPADYAREIGGQL
jgi:glycine cleavage system H protein